MATVILIVFILACSNNNLKKEKTAADTTKQPTDGSTGDNSENCLDWPGAYTGTIPSTGCDSISTTIILQQNLRFTRSCVPKGNCNSFTEQGNFTWRDGGTIATVADDKKDTTYYLVGENLLILLNTDGKLHTDSVVSEKYELNKIK